MPHAIDSVGLSSDDPRRIETLPVEKFADLVQLQRGFRARQLWV
jgi:hypothetical protein